MAKFDRQTWAQIQYQSILMQYEKEGMPSPFDDAYFAAVEKRYDAKFTTMTKLMIGYTVLMIVLAMSVFGLQPEVSQFGVTIKVDLARELLLWMAAVISTFLALIHNDVLLMKAMLAVRIRLIVEKGPFKDALMQEKVRDAIGLRHMDTYMQHLPAHSGPFHQMDTKWNAVRGLTIAAVGIVCVACIIASNIGLMCYVIYTIWNDPALYPWLTKTICVFAVASNLLWVALGISYRTRNYDKPAKQSS